MKVQLSEIKRLLKKRGLNENFITSFLSKVSGDRDKKQKILQKYEKAINKADAEIEAIINSEESEEEKDRMRALVRAYHKAYGLD